MSGEWQQAPENTLQSLRHGIINSDGVEFDLRLSSDGKLVIHHDSIVSIPKEKREGRPKWLDSWSLDELKDVGFTSFEDGVGNKKGPFPSSDVSETPLAGVGLDIDLSDKLALNISSSYRNADEVKAYKHFQHVIGVSIKLGSLDSDGDGISDKNDECPDVPGLEEFAGCPDTEGDGIADKEQNIKHI